VIAESCYLLRGLPGAVDAVLENVERGIFQIPFQLSRSATLKKLNGALSPKALTYFADGDLPRLSPGTQEQLRTFAAQVNLKRIPVLRARSGVTGEGVRT